MSFAQNVHREEIYAALVSLKPNFLLGKPAGFGSQSASKIRVARVFRVQFPLLVPEPAELNPGGISYGGISYEKKTIVWAIRTSIDAGRCNWRGMS